MHWRGLFVLAVLVGGLTLAGLASPAAAQSTNATPVIVSNTAPVDAAAMPLLDDSARKAMVASIAALKSGSIAAYILSVSPDGKFWSGNKLNKKQFINLRDMARQSLETCEYTAHAPCLIATVNGHDGRDATGGWPLQPRMLMNKPGAFDADRVPFVSYADRALIKSYENVSGPRALVVTTYGGWLWRTSKTVFQAIATADTDCHKTYPGQTCLLYAVNDRVVFSP